MKPRLDRGSAPRAAAFSTLLASMLLALPAAAATYRVDDSMTLPNAATTNMRWKSAGPTRTNADQVEGAATVTVRLNLQPWLNRNGRLYMALAQQPQIGQVNAEWTTQGRLLPGSVVSGQRTLVYSGPIRTALLEETLIVKVQADGKRLAMPQRLEFSFEIDVD